MSFNKAIIFSTTLIALFVIAPLAAFAAPLIVTTQEVVDIKERSATVNGLIDRGDYWFVDEVDRYGLYWSTSEVLNTATADRSDRGDANLPVEFSIEIKDLQPGTSYYVWAWADPEYFTPVYGNRLSFTTLLRPVVSTQAVTDIGSTTALGHGTIKVLGIPLPTQHGICWDTRDKPTINDEKTEEGAPGDIGPFASKITGLKTNKKYYVRAYATNAAGTVYGEQVSFKSAAGFPLVTTQAVTAVTENSATANATLVDVGEPSAVQHGVCWSAESMPLYSPESCIDKGEAVSEGPYKVEITGLESGTTYYVRAFVSNESDVYHYGDEVSFVTLSLPVVSTLNVTDISTNEASANGTLVGLGIPAATAHGICWDVDGSPVTAGSCVDLGAAGDTGTFAVTLTDLAPGTTYFVRAFATNQAGTTYGEEISFTSIDAAAAPRAIITNPPPAITRQTAYQLKVSGSSIVQYRFSLDDSLWSEPLDVDMALTFDLTTEGPHWLRVLGKDKNGIWQARQSATVVTWTLDTTPPSVELSNAPQGTIGPIPLRILVQGNDVLAYRYRLEDTGTWSAVFPVAVPITLPKLPDGPYTLAVIGADLAGNWQEQDDDNATTIKWIVDARVPTALLTNLPNAVTNETSIAIKVTAPEGGVAVDEYYYTFTDSGRWFHGDASEPIVVSGLPEGEYSLCVNAGNGLGIWQDGSDGTASMDSATCYTWHIDLTPPDLVQPAVEMAPPIYIHEGLSIASRGIKLTWAWQSEDEDDEKEAIQRYRVWQAEHEITADNLETAVELFCEIQPGPEGYAESFVVNDLAKGKNLYFAVEAIDKAGNSSALSSVGPLTIVDRAPEISDMGFKEGGMQADNASTATLSLTGNNFINVDGGNFIRFENRDAGFLLVGTLEAAGRLKVQIPLGMPTDIYWVRVVNANGISDPGPELITIVDAENPVPGVRDVIPRIASIGSTQDIIIKGDHFEPSAGVSLVSQEGREYQTVYDVVVQDSQTIFATVVTDEFPEGIYDIRVANTETTYNQFSAIRMELYAPQKLEGASGGIETHKIIQLKDGIVPVATTLKTRNQINTGADGTHRLKMKIFLTPGLAFEAPPSEQSEAHPFDGHLLPPRETGAAALVVDTLGAEAIQLSMGADVMLQLKNNAAMFANMEITLSSRVATPKVYYIRPDGGLEPAGIQGAWQGVDIEQGGTILSARPDTPEAGQTTYSLGLLLDHFSAYAIGSTDSNSFSEFLQSEDAYGPCFISTTNEETGLHLRRTAPFIAAIGTLALFLLPSLYRKRPIR